MRIRKYTEDILRELAKGYSSKVEFYKGNCAAYTAARKLGLLDKIFGKNVRWTEETIREDAKKYSSKTEFSKGNNSAYTAAIKNYKGLLDEIFGENVRWTEEMIREEAKKYSSKTKFRKGNSSAYGAAYKLGILDDIFGKYEGKGVGYWTETTICEEAKKYSSKIEFQKGNRGAYAAARRLGLLDKIFGENVRWTEETLRAEVSKYTSRGELYKKNTGAYSTACKKYRYILDEVFGPHMYMTKKGMLNLLSLHHEDLCNLGDMGLMLFVTMGYFSKKIVKAIRSPKPLKESLKDLEGEINNIDHDQITDDDCDDVNDDIEDTLCEGEDTNVVENNLFNEESLEEKCESFEKMLSAADSILNDDESIIKVSDGETSAALINIFTSHMWNLVLCGVDKDTLISEMRPKLGAWGQKVLDIFENDYNEVSSIHTPSDYGFPKGDPNLMQKLIANRMMNNSFFGNWSAPGAGKTNSMLLSASLTNRKMVVVVCPNSVVSTIDNAVQEFYNDSITIDTVIVDDINKLHGYVPSADRTFIVINYEKFQQDPEKTKALIKDIETLVPDMIVFDEIHRAKEEARVSSGLNKYLRELRKTCAKANTDLKVLGMTATPCVNKVSDVRNIMELLTGLKYDEIGDKAKNIFHCCSAYQALLLNGFRYIPQYPMARSEKIVKINHSIPFDKDIYSMLKSKNGNKWSELDKMLADTKFKMMVDQNLINHGHTIVYTNYVTGIVDNISEAATANGVSHYVFTGENKEDYNPCSAKANSKMDRDVIIGSKPISTGVDGLQYCCDTIIIMSMPYTFAEYEQLAGRIYRQGSVFKDAKIIRLNVTIKSKNGATDIDLDQRRFEIVDNKKKLCKAVVDGNIKEIFRYREDDLKEGVKKTAKKYLSGEIADNAINRESI